MAFVVGLAGWLGGGTVAAPERASATHVPDFIADAVEVTQGVQNLKNTVPLVEDRRTYVRFYGRVSGGPLIQETGAVLLARKLEGPNAGAEKLLLPINAVNAGANVKVLHRHPIESTGSFVRSLTGSLGPALFELPEGFTDGTVRLTAFINPSFCFVPPCAPAEHNVTNNRLTKTVFFDEVLGGPSLEVHRVGYGVGGSSYLASGNHVKKLLSWLERAYPIPELMVTGLQTLNVAGASVKTDQDGNKTLTKPTCKDINFALGLMYFTFSPSERRYGIVDDGGGFMRGCAPVPGKVASGPTGSGTFGWDFDGSYGDWYGGHELAHSFGRKHASFCGAKDGSSYPHPDGRISPLSSPGNASSILGEMFGFDIQTRAVYPPWWKDVMTYCDNQWVSDFTYKGLKSTFQKLISSQPVATSAPHPTRASGSAQVGQFIRVVGVINPRRERASLGPIFAEEAIEPPAPLEPGRYAIVFRGPGGSELARHRFRPLREGPGPPAPWDRRRREYERLLVMHAVPVPGDGTAPLRRLELVGPGGRIFASVQPGAASPTLAITAPEGGEVFDGDAVEVSWEASDPDGDRLTFMVQHRPGPDFEWKTVAPPTGARRARVPFSNLPSGELAAFRVLASDGLHTQAAETSAPFAVANRPPEVEIVSPKEGEVFVGEHDVPLNDTPVPVSEPVALEAFAHDADVGLLSGELLTWRSSIDGFLGSGAKVTVDSLSEGDHAITVAAEDGRGGHSAARVAISVVGSPEDLPPIANGLAADPPELGLAPHNGRERTQLIVFERNLGTIRWRARASKRWLRLGAQRGTTPARLQVSLVRSRLPKGRRARGAIHLTSPDFPGQLITVQAVAEIARCSGMIVTRLGTPARDVFRGTGRSDVFLLGAGSEAASGRGGRDVVCGGPGNDRLRGGMGNDVLDGGPGRRDRCNGGPGRDKLRRCERVR